MSKVRATNRRSWMRRGLAAASGLALGASMVAFAAPANAAGCSVDYTVNSWGTGFTANVTITNLGSAINGWTLEWDFPGNQQVTNLWNGTYTQSGQHVSVSNAPYNASIPANGTVEFGFNGSYSGSNDIPSSFKLNGVTCDGSDDPHPQPRPHPSPAPQTRMSRAARPTRPPTPARRSTTRSRAPSCT